MELKEELKKYRDSGMYPLHMPGHKRNTMKYELENPYGLDITEIHGFDDLHEPEGILLEGMQRAARVYGSREAWYLVNGSTAGILAGIAALAKPGGRLLTARNCHKSVYHALLLNGLEPVWMMPEVVDGWGFSGSISTKVVENALKTEKIDAVVVTSPTYEGVLSDIARIAEVCHAKSVPLLVDEAHGAHLGFGPFPSGAVAAGADLVVQSLHKTLPAFTQTGLLHLQGNLVEAGRVKHFLDIYQTSSPSYILMAGIGSCVRLLEESADFTREWAEGLEMFYRGTAGLEGLRVFGNPFQTEAGQIRPSGRRDRDPSKLVISTAAFPERSGPELAGVLREEYGFEVEMAAADTVIAMTGAGDRPEALLRFAKALQAIDANWIASAKPRTVEKAPETVLPVPETVLSLREASGMAGCSLPFTEALRGRISLEPVYAYPPGIPLLVPGERITKEVYRELMRLLNAGIPLRGTEIPGRIRVAAVEKP